MTAVVDTSTNLSPFKHLHDAAEQTKVTQFAIDGLVYEPVVWVDDSVEVTPVAKKKAATK